MASSPVVDEVLAAVDRLGSCLAAQDFEGTIALLSEDPDVTVIASEGIEAHRGRSAVDSFFRRIYAAPTRYRWQWRDQWVSVGGDQAAFVAVRDEFVHGVDAERAVIPYCLTGTLVRRDGAWRFLVLHGSEDSAKS